MRLALHELLETVLAPVCFGCEPGTKTKVHLISTKQVLSGLLVYYHEFTASLAPNEHLVSGPSGGRCTFVLVALSSIGALFLQRRETGEAETKGARRTLSPAAIAIARRKARRGPSRSLARLGRGES